MRVRWPTGPLPVEDLDPAAVDTLVRWGWAYIAPAGRDHRSRLVAFQLAAGWHPDWMMPYRSPQITRMQL